MRQGHAVLIAACLAVLVVHLSGSASAQEEPFGVSDTIFAPRTVRIPAIYTTTYDRDVSTGTWTQSLSYSLTKPRLAMNTNGSYYISDQLGLSTQRSGGGTFSGRLDVRATKNWFLTAEGRYNKASIHDPISESIQRQNRLKLSGQYSSKPVRGLIVQGLLFSEFQEDHSLALRPAGRGTTRVLVIRDQNGDSIAVDTLFVQRDSTLTTGRQDGLSGLADWKPRPWFRMVTSAFGTRVRPSTTSYLGGNQPRSSEFQNRVERTGSNPNDNYQYQSKMTYQGPRGLQALLNLSRVRLDQSYYDRGALRQELFSSDQRSGALHLEQAPLRGVVFMLDGSMRRSLGQYRFLTNLNNLVSSKSGKAALYYNPSVATRGGLDFSVDSNRNSRQQFGNGTNVTRLLQLTGAHRLSRRLNLDAMASASLTSFQYVDSTQDQDNGRAFANLGTGYQVSSRCSTQVHFSVNRGHSVAIDPSQSANNSVQTTYQMDAQMKLGVTSRINITQLYLLNALYQIYDFPSAESKNTLSRIRRIDTIMSDSLFSFATLQLIHNFLFRDFGSFSRLSPGVDRAYRVFSQTYVQTVAASMNVKPVSGVLLTAAQSLSNARVETSAATTVSNHWNFTFGATVDRPIFNGVNVNGAVQHISAYDEKVLPTDPTNRDDYWVAGVTLIKSF